jgi:hypothetical protein
LTNRALLADLYRLNTLLKSKLVQCHKTQRTYTKAIADFYQRVYDEPVSARSIANFLTLPPSEALFQVLHYRWMPIEAKLAPSMINVRLSALKSLVDYARKMSECAFSLNRNYEYSLKTKYREAIDSNSSCFPISIERER